MPQLVEPTTPEAQHEIIRQSLDEIATEVGTALHDAHFDFPVFLTVPNSGDSLATMAVLSIRPTATGHMHPPSFAASSGNDWAMLDCAESRCTARWRMRQSVPPRLWPTQGASE